MKKIGRNAPCPCGSGLKYKKCCLPQEKQTAAPDKSAEQQQAFVTNEVTRLQERASAGQGSFQLFGSLVFFSNEKGDAWLLELAEQDALKVSRDGTELPVVIEESEDYLEINWTHSFVINGGQFITTAYLDNSVDTYNSYPVTTIKDAQKKIQRKFSDQELQQIHMSKQETNI
jgi:hypothetical protein